MPGQVQKYFKINKRCLLYVISVLYSVLDRCGHIHKIAGKKGVLSMV